MSAIAGIYHFSTHRPVEVEEIHRMGDRLSHRGADGKGTYCQGAVGFGHRLLWTTPESLLEHLPLTQGSLTITADARIDNREELMVQLGLTHYAPEKMTDSGLILAAYRKWGEACAERLLGDFAFAIWDSQHQCLFCARDYFGVKPFYYYSSGRSIYFASEIKALVCLPEVPCRLNEVRVGDYLEVCLEDTASTFYQDIWRLPPAHYLLVNGTGLRVRPYWSPNPRQELRLKSSQDYAEAYLDVFTEAVRCRLRSAFPIGSTLSGGLDSSSITCVARSMLAPQNALPLKTFSAVFEDTPECDERPYIQAVLAQGGLEPTFVDASRLTPLTDLERMFWHQDELFYTPNLYIHWGLYGAAQQQGVRVFLDGYLGDNVVYHGWTYRSDLARSWRWLPLAHDIWATARRYPEMKPWEVFQGYLWHESLKPLIPEPLLRLRRRLLGYGEARRSLRPTTLAEFADRIQWRDRLDQLERRTDFPGLSPSRLGHYRNLVGGDVSTGLEVANKAAAAFGIDTRFPFTDRRLAELCLSIPSRERLHDGLSRMFVRRAMVNHLPAKVCWRQDKGNLSANFHRGLREVEGDRVQQVLLHELQRVEPFVNIVKLHQLYAYYQQQPSTGEISSVWLVLSLALWLHYSALAKPPQPQENVLLT